MSEPRKRSRAWPLDICWTLFRASLGLGPPPLGWSRPASVGLAHLGVMDTAHATQNPIEAVFTIAELATDLSVSTQALYDLRSKGRGPTGFRVGRQLRFRQSESDAWLARLEAEDHTRHHHPGGARRPAGDREPSSARSVRSRSPTSAAGTGPAPSTQHRDLDGRLRKVSASATSKKGAEALLKRRLLDRPGHGSGGVLSLASPFPDLAELWLADLEVRDIYEGTKDNYRDDLRLHVRPFFEHYTLGEITTGRVEHFLKSERRVSYSRAKHARTVLNSCSGSRCGTTRCRATLSRAPRR